jgi:hypothetical protein
MKKLLMGMIFCGLVSASALAQKTGPSQTAPGQKIELPADIPMFSPADLAAKVPAAKPEDVKSQEGILRGIYDVISGPAGDRDWKRFRSMFLPQARFTEVGKAPDGSTFVISWSVDEFVRDGGQVFAKDAFYENAIVNQAQTFGNMTQVFSSYESRRSPAGKPFERGINSIQLLNDGSRWWVVSIFWDSERADNPLPAGMTKK